MSVDAAYRVSPLDPDDLERLGPYRLAGRLGSGGMGVVYLGLDPDDRYVAIKLVHAWLAGDPEFRGRFRSEVERARQVPSYCTAEVLDADLDHNPPYLVVEYVDGPSLADVVDDRGPLSYANLHSVAVGVATALTGIHGAGVIHRDLKPENVLLAPGSPKVIDFGIARAFEATSGHTRTDQMVGTVAYMAPERFSSEPGTPLTAAADVFAWGCVIAYAGTGRTPFHGDSPAATAARILTQPPHLGRLKEPLRDLVRLTLAKEPEDRPTARELLDLLVDGPPPPPAPALPAPLPARPLLAGRLPAWSRSPAAYGAPQPVFAEPPVRRTSRLLVLLAVLLVVAGIATVIAVLWTAGDPLAATRDDGRAAGAPAVTTAVADPTVLPAKPPALKPSPIRPARPDPVGRAIIQDSLSQPGQWLDSEVREQNARCVVKNVLRASRSDRGTFQCEGPKKRIPDGFSVAVTTSLETLGSCASVWIHWDDQAGGQVLRICQEGFALAEDTPADQRLIGTLSLGRPIPLHKAVRVKLVVGSGVVGVFMSGDLVGRIPLPPDSARSGQVVLGISVPSLAVPPPYDVTFADIDLEAV
jgi:hypothetical protein